jgi:hypothetical protein
MNLIAPEPNPHLKKLDQLQAAKRKWQESEWLLSFLRTETGLPVDLGKQSRRSGSVGSISMAVSGLLP